ncbi:hypothetical protein DB88DRAFT_62383 [Papiliotrema laurentii]|uniref:Uncharacterized protein n=1 Tax=Papiliotrema laurentii TaxID=5418 RepID=A0AAD9LAB8_PAPLA|nr:hypothetical protein DB88DRAFT_62383 [Papiliotrema laurentii]
MRVETYLIFTGCVGIIEGTDTEPLQAVPEGTAAETAHSATEQTESERLPEGVRAGSCQPATNTDPQVREAWEKWSMREGLSQGVIRSTVSRGWFAEIYDKRSAREMWESIAALQPTNTDTMSIRRAIALEEHRHNARRQRGPGGATRDSTRKTNYRKG